MQITANNPDRISWIKVSEKSDFPIQNIPFGVFITKDDIITIGTRIGDTVIDLGALQQLGYFKGIKLSDDVFLQDSLNDFIAHGRKRWREVRNRIADLFDVNNPELQTNEKHRSVVLFDENQVEMLLPITIGDFTEFYANEHFIKNHNKIFNIENPFFMSEWKQYPIAYQARASSVVVSGTPIVRPKGQIKNSMGILDYLPTQQLDFEIEMGFFTTDGCHLGDSLKIEETEEHIFGLVLLNQWSARDIQCYETKMLAPYLSKNFATSISPWIVTLDALEPFRTQEPEQNPTPLPYLQKSAQHAFDIQIHTKITTATSDEKLISTTNFKNQYWTMNQQLAHHTSNGCNIRTGDLFASGTISSLDTEGLGCLMEMTSGGKTPITLNNGSLRTYLLDNDKVSLNGFCENETVRIGFGKCCGKVLPYSE